jgi:hypothetical protein
MTARQSIKVFSSRTVTGQGIIAELRYHGTGLRLGTHLTSRETGRRWTVKARLLFNHTLDRQRRFQGETENHIHFSFENSDKRSKSSADILDKEGQGIYQYLLSPQGHEEKPTVGDQLDLEP